MTDGGATTLFARERDLDLTCSARTPKEGSALLKSAAMSPSSGAVESDHFESEALGGANPLPKRDGYALETVLVSREGL